MSWVLWPNELAQFIIALAGVQSEEMMGFIVIMSLFFWLVGAVVTVAMVCAPFAGFGYFVFKLVDGWGK